MAARGSLAPGNLWLAVFVTYFPLVVLLGMGGQHPAVAPLSPTAPPVLHLRSAALPPISGILALLVPDTPAPAPPTPAVDTAASSQSPMIGHLHLVWPLSGIVTSPFGWRIHPIFGTREFHTGMDIATRWGAPVLAASSGIVRFTGWMAGYGELIVVDHGNGLETAYSHLSAMDVQLGAPVTQGQPIGRVGNTGWSTGPHLFFEVRRNGVPIDPARYLN